MHRGEEGGNQSQLEGQQENILLEEWEQSQQQSQKDEERGTGTTSKVVTDFLRIQFAYWKGSKGITQLMLH